MKRFLPIAAIASLAGCGANMTGPTAPVKTTASICIASGGYLRAITLAGTPTEQTQALKTASILTPACSAATSSQAASATVIQAANALQKLAANAKLQSGLPATGRTTP